ncbi:MAG: hypothetical protein ASUL_03129 [Candidatus Aramenus sulfurataquae]|jgi:sulfur carrier protein|uniref:MoaD/ThiS family protein n=2 Tax=Candidatus Aramenus sulfurataquae TaxID=1326980 RepID=W7KMJ5_9CREN|nr:MAG: hypothetical protein ASUL_03129 [Candidatus Aramenus sulfurataquae]MBW9141867.1 MoaD/ThiS family protein [Candidatus Aramenus sp.]MCI2415365.1 MoaD/ThiS family protein [Candidatus Aramenus sp.]MCL7343669.1 MoaD/ThiS family protein [Candidatus Aramenus sulfurataquae]
MKVKVLLVREKREVLVDLPENSRVKDLVKSLGYNVQGVVVLRNDVPIVEDDFLRNGDELKIILTASGG